jgi:putative ABC transport system permease protein
VSVAVRKLLAEKVRFGLSVLGVGVAVLLVLMMSGIFVGTTRQVTTYIDHSRDAVWVMQPGVSQMFKSVSWLPDADRAKLTAVPEIASAEPILGLPSDFVHNGTHTAFFVVGYDTSTGVGGPWALAEGRNVDASGEIVLDRALARINPVHLGDTVRIVDRDFTVVGLSRQTAAATNFYTFISLTDAKRLLRAGDRVSYFLVQPKPGYSPEDVVTAIGRDVPGVAALTSATFADNSRDIIVKMIGRPLKTMIAIAVLVGTALIGLTMWAVTAEQMADFGILRALGVRPIQVSRVVLAQAAVIAACGFVLGGAVAFAAQFLIGDRMGDVAVAITPPMLGAMAAGTAGMAALGALLPLRRVSRIDPVAAFRR